MNKTTISILIAALIIGGAIIFSAAKNDANGGIPQSADNVSVVDGKQIIEITAKGGYSPKTTSAKAGIPTFIKIKTKGAFDCSLALTIPALNYRKNLPPTGETLIEVPAQDPGSTLRGVCTMGMYSFTIKFD